MTNLPFTFAWVDPGTAWDATAMNRCDEVILGMKVDHQEGQIPTLDLTIKNPRIGLLAPSRKRYAWLGWTRGDGTLVPLFYGVLVGIPSNLFKETISIQLIARPDDFISQKQAAAEGMKIAPFYDPIWLDERHRDDPDSILEGWSALWHIDRLTNSVTASDVLDGEDGTVLFDQGHAFYDSVGLTLGQPPLANIRVEATVNWTQRTSGFFDVPPINLATYTGDSFFGEWPKPGASLGGGYKVSASFMYDVYHVSQTPMTSYQSQWHNSDPHIGQCSNESATSQSSGPALLSPDALTCVLTGQFKTGVCFPDSDPPTNTPMTLSVTGMIVPKWFLGGTMSLRYDASRAFSEIIAFDMIANTQSILATPTVDQNTELLTISASDIGKPLVEVKAWTSFANAAVPIATFIWPNNPTLPGGLAYQICVTAGVAGATEPEFSDLPGVTTDDGTVVWASLGPNGFTDAWKWAAGAGVPVGQIMLLTDSAFNENLGDWEDIPGATSYYLCIRSGVTNGNYVDFTYIPPVFNNDEGTPEPRTLSWIDPPAFVTSVGSLVNDGNVQWYVLGTSPPQLSIPIGGTANDVQARCFFPTTRGNRAVEYLISKARARLRWRSRAVSLEWDCPFEMATTLSCRYSATLFDPRLPGEAATGKITGYSFSADGNTGKLIGHVQVGCAVGLAGSINEITGTPTYVAAGYVQPGYQVYDGKMVAAGSNDITYSPPVFQPFDDGLSYPLRWQDISDGGQLTNTSAAQKEKIVASFKVAQQLVYLQSWSASALVSGSSVSTQSGLDSNSAWTLEREQMALASQNTPYVMQANAVSWSVLLKPCAGSGPFEGAYFINVSQLEIPKGIDLAAVSSI